MPTDTSTSSLPDSMLAIVTTGHGGYECLETQQRPVPTPGEGEVLIKVLAAGMNNTEINTRLGWYSSTITTATQQASSVHDNADADAATDKPAPPEGGWKGETPFPLIQGTDCCGEVVALGPNADASLLGKRVLVRSCMRSEGWDSLENEWMGSDFDGAFAQFVSVRASEVFAVDCDWSDVELGSLPCAYGTAENMLEQAELKAGERVLILGASGGVGSAALQLAKRRGATVYAVAGVAKHEALAELGADRLLDRKADLLELLGHESVDLVVDNVAGDNFPIMMKLLSRGGRLVTTGAIAGPMVTLDLRDLYLKNLRLLGTTAWCEATFPNLIRYVEQGEIRPLIAASFPLTEIVSAQQQFLSKGHVGKFVLEPWA
ncbi:alcohol dehydrogenase family protein [Cobetia sp. cqz5-12]|uniref:alcohol dehydrogenase family protein n=1 Tax=Cobetia sp. cqz5-12 TaxID=2609415 RepID=UPI00190342EB|nr:alcohol dehydrogenase family protein [Cobetia sp. cqz5-12]